MDELTFTAQTVGFFTRAQARDTGYSDTEIAYAVRRGHWHRLRRGYFAPATRGLSWTRWAGTASSPGPLPTRSATRWR
ncbi:MAG: type IV toxin-antitoxin system AbiEi family antitoxin domain-containing protein [Nocardioides sp.]